MSNFVIHYIRTDRYVQLGMVPPSRPTFSVGWSINFDLVNKDKATLYYSRKQGEAARDFIVMMTDYAKESLVVEPYGNV